jgi:hypothetical protein
MAVGSARQGGWRSGATPGERTAAQRGSRREQLGREVENGLSWLLAGWTLLWGWGRPSPRPERRP